MSGIHTIADLMDRCVVEYGCWLWKGGTSTGGRPCMWLPALGRHVSAGTAICVLTTGRAPLKREVWHTTCGTPNCCNPAHRIGGTKASMMRLAAKPVTHLSSSRIAAAKRAKSHITDEMVRDIRESTEPLRVVAARHGVSIDYASKVRRGLVRRETGYSVFTLGSR